MPRKTVASAIAGPAPTISLSASSLDFGTESVDYISVTQTVTLTNSSVVPLFLSSTGITITGTNPEDFPETDTCAGRTIAPGTSCTIDVNFWPGAAGTRSAVLCITDNAADSPQRVALSGIGQFAVADVSPLALDFGAQVVGTTSAAQSVRVQNNSQADLGIFALLGAAFDTTGAFTATTSDCFVDAIAPGQSCTFDVRFMPQATGSATGALFIFDNAADSPQMVGQHPSRRERRRWSRCRPAHPEKRGRTTRRGTDIAGGRTGRRGQRSARCCGVCRVPPPSR